MGIRRDEELAQTLSATAGGESAEPAAPLDSTLGRYRLERELGAGAMGVVHAAFDPDLERRIAVKVLKGATATTESRDRLLREARAMARLAHPNVVTVHEVGTASGRDFVAMELIDGGSLADWLRGERRSPADILDAFVAAGRGLAAAHTAGIVHRDFKPHNVLRSRDGRIVVTDFGLARDVADAPADAATALDATLPASARSVPALTMTGALLGTPAYMAPEQWRGDAISPATDQFAYCVALWEALAGARPYPGPTFNDLRAQIARGPAALDASRIPRRLRGVLARGLDPDPARRWPSMDALLARLVRVQRRPLIAFALVVGALVAAGVLGLAVRGDDAPIAGCTPPARDPAAVWSTALRDQMQATTSGDHAGVLDAAYASWHAARIAACAAPPRVRSPQLACLDGALNRLDLLRQTFAQVPAAAAEEIQAQLVEPAICLQPAATDVPRLTLAPTSAVLQAYALFAHSQTAHKPSDAQLLAVAEQPTADPCARAVAAIAFADASYDVTRARTVLSQATSSVDQCGDERLRADLLLRAAAISLGSLGNHDRAEAVARQAEIAATRVMQPDLAAAVADLHRAQAAQRDAWDDQFQLIDKEIDDYRARGLARRQLHATIVRDRMWLQSAAPDELDAITADFKRWRPVAAAQHWDDLTWWLDFDDALVRMARGDIAGTHAELVRLGATPPNVSPPATTITGEVVDDHGRPAAGATVAAGHAFISDAVGIGLPFDDDHVQVATADRAGRFAIHGDPGSLLIAQLGDLRSRPVASTDRPTVRLEPTRGVRGKVDLGGVPSTRVTVFATALDVALPALTIAPVAADGTFSLAGLSRGGLFLTVHIGGRDPIGVSGSYLRLPASSASVTGVVLVIKPATRELDVVVRSAVAATLDAASVWVLPGHWNIQKLGDLLHAPVFASRENHPQPMGAHVPPALAGTAHPDDLLQHLEHVPDGELTVCAGSLPTDGDALAHMRAHLADFVIKCKQIANADHVIVLDVPPQPRFD